MKVVMVKVKFEGTVKQYSYLCLESLGVKPGDKVVVEARDTTAVVTVKSVHPDVRSDITLRWVLAKEDDLVGAMLETKRRWEEYEKLRDKLMERKKKFEGEYIWEILAEKDPVAAKLLKRMKELEGQEDTK